MAERLLNGLLWQSEDGRVFAERRRGGVEIRVNAGNTFIGNAMNTDEADSLGKWLIECGIAERTEEAYRG